MPLLDGRIKQSLASCKVRPGPRPTSCAPRRRGVDADTPWLPSRPSQQVSVFLKARAKVEESYARSLGEMGRDLVDQYARSEGKAGSVLAGRSLLHLPGRSADAVFLPRLPSAARSSRPTRTHSSSTTRSPSSGCASRCGSTRWATSSPGSARRWRRRASSTRRRARATRSSCRTPTWPWRRCAAPLASPLL